jgi:hypothetical protein
MIDWEKKDKITTRKTVSAGKFSLVLVDKLLRNYNFNQNILSKISLVYRSIDLYTVYTGRIQFLVHDSPRKCLCSAGNYGMRMKIKRLNPLLSKDHMILFDYILQNSLGIRFSSSRHTSPETKSKLVAASFYTLSYCSNDRLINEMYKSALKILNEYKFVEKFSTR